MIISVRILQQKVVSLKRFYMMNVKYYSMYLINRFFFCFDFQKYAESVQFMCNIGYGLSLGSLVIAVTIMVHFK